MTSTDLSPGVATQRVLVGLQIGEDNIGVSIDATVPVSRQIHPLVDVVNKRLAQLGKPALPAGDGSPAPRGRWALCWADGAPLRPGRGLADQGVVDGMRLWLRFVEDTEARLPVVEHITSAIAPQLRSRWPSISPAWAVRVGAGLVAAAVALVLAVLTCWRDGHDDGVAAIAAAVIAAAVLLAALVVGLRSARNRRRGGDPRQLDGGRVIDLSAELAVADTLLLVGAAAAAVAAALAVPGPLGGAHAALGSAVLVAGACLVVRFTGRHIAVETATIVVGSAVLVAGAARMLVGVSPVTLLGGLLLVGLLGVKLAPAGTRVLAGLKLPVFPSPTSRWVFDTRPDLPMSVVVAAGETPTLEGPESVRNLVVEVDRAHAFLTGLLTGAGTLVAICAVALCDPHADYRVPAVVLAITSAGGILLHARSYTDRGQATVLAVLAAAVPILVALRVAVGLWTVSAVLVSSAVIVALSAAGLAGAAVIPRHIYSPVFKQAVEWFGYLLLFAPFPLAFWVMGVFAAIRYRS